MTAVSELTFTPPLTLTTLPPELNLELFKHLDVCTSVCLGLTCKKLWAIHSQKGIVKLYTMIEDPYMPTARWRWHIPKAHTVKDLNGKEHKLGELLKQCVGPNYWLPFLGYKFMPTWPYLRQLQSQRDRAGNEQRKKENTVKIQEEARQRKAKKAMEWRQRGLLMKQGRSKGATWVEVHRPFFSAREGAML
jgi:hypothetical protein